MTPPLSDTAAVEPDLVAPFEKVHFYHGISPDPPELLFRSDLETNPFVIPKGRFSAIPEKTVHGVFDATLRPIWSSTVAPAIIALLKEEERRIRLSTLMAVRFSTPDENGQDVFGPIVIWISVHPNTTTAVACRDASPDIIRLLESHGVKGAVVHWYEGAVERLSGPPMMRVARSTDPTSYIRRALTAVLGLPLAAGMGDDDSQGSLAFFFHENEDERGNPSGKVFGVTNKHVVQKVTNADCELGRGGAAKAYTRALIAKNVGTIQCLAEEIVELEKKPAAEDDASALKRNKRKLGEVNEDNVKLGMFLKDLNANWSDALQRTIGWVDWAPKIRSDVDSRAYTLDICTFELEKHKWEKEFKGNFVYLGGKYSDDDITAMFYPNATTPLSFKYPKDHLFRILGFVAAERLANPDFYDEQGNAAFIVAKDGQSSDLTFGRYSALEAYTCDEFGHDSWEVAVFNYDKRSGNFSASGDSGSLIFNAEGKMVAILHSGMPRGLSSHVTFATPAHFIIEQIKLRYPKADFARLEF
ncbi:hypothetical protein K488DRAFT_49453 [Vararia minispora EC-137]|uniref:Uncharacterized protein n=1 Tax=Vararia minispora EC-137 TaxID=1314806 RepID=A0ACB8QML0_9AGAM|nr:hypothetical protein K488DRAFT_49453 [Vararia minispora EC-137]